MPPPGQSGPLGALGGALGGRPSWSQIALGGLGGLALGSLLGGGHGFFGGGGLFGGGGWGDDDRGWGDRDDGGFGGGGGDGGGDGGGGDG